MENVHLERRVIDAKNEIELVIDELIETINHGQQIITNLENKIEDLENQIEELKERE